MLRLLVREPLVHFVIIGSLLFAAYSMLAQAPDEVSVNRIVVDAALVNRLERDFVRQWRRPPDDLEREVLIQEYLREEVLYREALARGLDRNDAVVRQRLARKMEAFAIIDAGIPAEPTQADLRAYFAEHAARFATPEQMSFTHVFLDRDARGDCLSEDAQALLEALRATAVSDADGLGDVPPIRPSHEATTKRDVARQFGRAFAERLFELPAGSWQGPVESGFGVHLVLIRTRTPSRDAAFEDVAFEVRSEYLENRRRELRSAVFSEMRRNYAIEMPGPDKANRQ